MIMALCRKQCRHFHEAERLQAPEFVAALAAREPAYQLACLHVLRGLTQNQLAELVGAKQS
ncbi:MAG: hypothetical protein R6W76_19305 [Caldilinea sp.]